MSVSFGLREVLVIVLLLFLPYLITSMSKEPTRFVSFFSRKRKGSRDLSQAKMVNQTSRLLALPDEILINIVEHLDHQDLLVARSVSTHLHGLVDPYLYKDYEISDGGKAVRLAAIITANPKRALWLRSVLVSTTYDGDKGLSMFPRQLQQMRNLKHLVLETPDCNSKLPADRVKWLILQQEYESILRSSTLAVPQAQRLLGNLESCTMHLVDESTSLYPLTKYSSIFVHPTLKSLTLSCACTDFPERLLAQYRRFKRSTALEYLHLEECDFDPQSLELLLKFPRGLKSLKLSEGTRYDNIHGTRQVRMHGNLTPTGISDALTRSVSDKLESLSLALGHINNRKASLTLPGRALNLTAITRLKHLSLSMRSLALVVSPSACDHQIYRRLPETLESFQVFSIKLLNERLKPATPFGACLYKAKAGHGLPRLNKIIYTYEYQASRGRSSQGLIQRPGSELLDRVVNLTKERICRYHNRHYARYKKSGVRMILEMDVTPPGFIPPYLNNEEKPVNSIFWDSDSVDCDMAEDQQPRSTTMEGGGEPALQENDDDGDGGSSSSSDEGAIEGLSLVQFATQLQELHPVFD